MILLRRVVTVLLITAALSVGVFDPHSSAAGEITAGVRR